jgi:hypothetical protein
MTGSAAARGNLPDRDDDVHRGDATSSIKDLGNQRNVSRFAYFTDYSWLARAVVRGAAHRRSNLHAYRSYRERSATLDECACRLLAGLHTFTAPHQSSARRHVRNVSRPRIPCDGQQRNG